MARSLLDTLQLGIAMDRSRCTSRRPASRTTVDAFIVTVPHRIESTWIALQRGQELFGGLKPFGRTLRQSLQNNPRQFLGHLRIHFGRRPWRLMQMRRDDGIRAARAARIERRTARHHLVQHGARRIHVRSRVRALPARLLGRNVIGRSEQRSRLRQRQIRVLAFRGR